MIHSMISLIGCCSALTNRQKSRQADTVRPQDFFARTGFRCISALPEQSNELTAILRQERLVRINRMRAFSKASAARPLSPETFGTTYEHLSRQSQKRTMQSSALGQSGDKLRCFIMSTIMP